MTSIVDVKRISCGDAMEDIFVVKRCNKIIIHGRRAGETAHSPPDAAVWYRIADTRTHGSSVTVTISRKTPGTFADSSTPGHTSWPDKADEL
jgi:hypothetical protein